MKHVVMFVAVTAGAMGLSSAGGCDDGEAPEPGDDAVASAIDRRFAGDRSGACVTAAVIEPDERGELSVARAWRCAGARQQALDGDVALEIGSITKTMTGMLLGQWVAEGKLGLDEPLQDHAPTGIVVPDFGGAPIRLMHLVTHTSGLPSIPDGLVLADPQNPYAQLRTAELWRVLGELELPRKPGTGWAYSNFAVMLLSSLVADAGGGSYEDVLRARILAPLGMTRSYLAARPDAVTAAKGHKVGGAAARAWDFGENLGGVGGVRATMDDMIRYAQAQLGVGDAAVVEMARRSHQRVELGEPRGEGEPEMGLGWLRLPFQGRTILLHDGGTGGFSSILLVDEEQRRAVVVLADTSLTTVGGVAELGLHLLDERQPLDGPRLASVPAATLTGALAGRYLLDGAIEVTLEERGGALWALLAGEALELSYDSHGDFYPKQDVIDGLLTPVRGGDGRQTFVWVSDGVPTMAERQ